MPSISLVLGLQVSGKISDRHMRDNRINNHQDQTDHEQDESSVGGHPCYVRACVYKIISYYFMVILKCLC